MKEARWGFYTTESHLYKILENANKSTVIKSTFIVTYRQRWRVCKEAKGTFGGDGYAHYLDGGDGFTSTHLWKGVIHFTNAWFIHQYTVRNSSMHHEQQHSKLEDRISRGNDFSPRILY